MIRLKPEGADELPSLGGEGELRAVRQGEAWLLFGMGRATEGGAIEGPLLQFGIKERVAPNVSLGAVHYNEGHADQGGHHNHRDGYAVVGCLDRPLAQGLKVEGCAGPYFSMNTTPIDGRERDDKRLGVLGAVALVVRLNRSGLGLRLQGNVVKMPAAFDTKTLMVGVSQELGGDDRDAGGSPFPGRDVRFNLFAGSVIANRTGKIGHLGQQAEIEAAIDRALHYSVSVIREGDSGITNRTGVAAQAWYVAPPAGKWKFSAGAGPYVARESYPDDRGWKLLAVVSFKAEREMGRDWSCALRFNRIVSNYDKDADMFLVGCERQLR